jgi:hypothetical protein
MFHPPQRLSAWPDGDQTTRIVFILRELEPACVRLYGTPLPDSLNPAAYHPSIRWSPPKEASSLKALNEKFQLEELE